MANYRAVANGNWSSGATWGGGAVPPNGEGHNIYSNNFTVTIDQNVNVALITNASVTASFVGGGTSAALGGSFSINNNVVITANMTAVAAVTLLSLAGSNSCTLNGNVTDNYNGGGAVASILHSSTGTLYLNGNVSSTTTSGAGCANISITGSGVLDFFGTINGSNSRAGSSPAVNVGTNASFIASNSIINAGSANTAINSSGTITIINGVVTATAAANAISASGTTRISGTLISALNGQQAVSASRWILNVSPTNAYIQHALNGINANSFVRYFTADNNLGQAAPSDVRNGVSYASGNLTGTLTVPVRGTIANGVTYGPSMPFTATRSGTTATATLTYSYPYQVGDTITVTGASNSEWNGDYTIASVISGTSVTFTVPSTHSATAGTGARMQTKGTAVLDGASVASAVWSAATRTLTSASGPTATEIRQEIDANSTSLSAIKAKTDALNTTRLGNVATVETTGAQLASALTAP